MSDELKLGEDDVDVSMRQSRNILTRVGLCLKLSTMHQMTNSAMDAPIRNLAEAVAAGTLALSADTARLTLQSVGENFFLNREIIKLDFTSFEAGRTLRGLLARMGAQEVWFTGAPSVDELRTFLTAFQTCYQGNQPQALLEQKFPHVGLRAISKAEEEALRPALDERKNLVRAYANLALVIDAQVQLLKVGKQARLAKVRRAIHGLADAVGNHEALLVALTRFEAFSGEVRFHLAASTALTLLMCRRLQLSRPALSEACMAAAFHDMAIDELLPSSEGPASETELEAEMQALHRVPLRTILRLSDGALGGDALERIAVAHEHTQPLTTGLPAGFGQLIAVPCVFDWLTRPRPPRKALFPDHALRLIVNQSGSRFDARVVQLFASVVGLFPVGTTVRLNSGELAIVMEVPAEPARFATPRVKVIRTPQGPADFVVDLAAPGEKRAILSSVDPLEVDVNVPQFLLA